MGRAVIAGLAVSIACSPIPNDVEAHVAGPRVVLDAESTSRSFVVHPCYESPERLESVQLTLEAEARAIGVGESDPWVRIFVDPIDPSPATDDDEEPEFVDARVTGDAPAMLSIEHLLDGSDLFDADIEEGNARRWLCEDGMAVVTFELVDPSGGGRVEIEWDASLRGAVFAEEETFDVQLEG